MTILSSVATSVISAHPSCQIRMQMASRRLPSFLILAVAAAISVDAGGNDALIKRNTAGTVTIG